MFKNSYLLSSKFIIKNYGPNASDIKINYFPTVANYIDFIALYFRH